MTAGERERNKNMCNDLLNQYPNPYPKDKWYPITLPNGKRAEMILTSGKGQQSGKSYIHIRIPTTIVLKTPAGEVLDRTPGYNRFRINLSSYEISTL